MLVTVCVLSLNCNSAKNVETTGTINPIIGDLSFQSKFGHPPSRTLDEKLRIQTHLEYIEGILRSRRSSEMPEHLARKREQMLDLLHEYRTVGLFPRNYDYPDQRKPCFIDRDGTICAVGYLVEQTASLDLAKEINSLHQYSEILEIDSPELEEWIDQSGLSLEEVAMIQPTYGPPDNYTYIASGYGIASSVLGGTNMAISAINITQLAKPEKTNILALAGLATGAASTTLGIVNMTNNYEYNGYFNEGKKILSMVNIAIGTATMCISGYSIFTRRKPKDDRTTWNIYCFPGDDDQIGVGFSFVRIM